MPEDKIYKVLLQRVNQGKGIMQILQDMISVRRIIINIMLVIPLHAVSQIDFTRPIVDTITYELQLRKVEFDQYFLKNILLSI